METRFRRKLLLSCFAFALLFSIAARAQDKDWRPISPDDLAAKKPSVESDADAEAIFWEVRIDDSGDEDLALKHYVRIKIYTERGRDKFSKLDVPFTKGLKIKDLAARVTRSDGTAVEIKKEDIFEREIIKASGLKIKAKSFAVPNIEPGVIIEYRYKEVFSNEGAKGMRLQFQKDIPVQKLSYYYKPYNKNTPKYQAYNFTDTKFIKDKDGYWLASRTNVPALNEEPRMPPEDMVRPWMLLTGTGIGLMSVSEFSISFSVKDPSSPPLYWAAVGAERGPLTKYMNKESGDIKKLASEITAGATTDDEKLKKIYEYCQTQIANTTFDPSITDEQRAKLPVTKAVSDVLKRKSANSQFIDMLFGSLAHAVGFETRIAYTGDRSKMFITPEMTNESLIHPAAIAVKVGNEWKYFNPGVRFLPCGMLVWYEEDTWALLVGEERYDWKHTSSTNFSSSATKRAGKFTLLEDGTLEGTVQMELNGQPGMLYRVDNYDETPAKLEENLTQEVKRRISTAEVSEVSVENLTDDSKPLLQKYKIRVPNYAQKTGKRLFLQPGFFEYGENAVFSSSSRKYDIFFQYPWSEDDHIEITYPKNFDLDNADAPGKVSDPSSIGVLDISLHAARANNALIYDRHFHFGGGGHVLFGSEVYTPLKGLFDAFHQADSHTVTLKQQ
jgi:Domain of Unknown Function with PDB structure (DUF3857)/Transglutaminase-like superfamily